MRKENNGNTVSLDGKDTGLSNDVNDSITDETKKGSFLYALGTMVGLLVIVATVIFFSSNRDKVEEMNDVFLVELATGMADKISAIMIESSALLKSTQAALSYLASDQEAMLEMLSQISDTAEFDAMFISFGDDAQEGVQQLLYEIGSSSEEEVFVTKPFIEESTGRESFALITPLYDGNEKIGELYGVFYLDEFASILDLKSFGGEAFFHLCTVDGTPLVLSGNNDNLFKDGDMYTFIGSLDMQNEHTVDSIRQDMQNEKTTLLKYKINDEERSAVMVTVPGTDWCVISIVLDEVTVRIAREINQSTLVFSVCVILLFGSFVATAMVQSLQKEKRLKKALLSSRQLAQKLKTSVEIDSLTRVYSRATATEKIIEVLNNKGNDDTIHTLVIADVDNFKLINDTHGHQIGDIYLQKFVHSIKTCLRSDDIFGRLGGDEFVILLNGVESQEASKKIALRILDKVNSITIQDVSLDDVGISIGMVMIPQYGTDYDELNNMADKALYDAKRSGKSTYTFYDDLNENK